MWALIRRLLFTLDAEKAHDLTLFFLKYTHYCLPSQTFKHPVHVFGLNFPNPVGLAAGLDKNGECLAAWSKLGFGFIEVGTVTPRPQSGNPLPRLFRLPEKQALINSMGFNNRGVSYLVKCLRERHLVCPVGVNIGKNKETSLQDAYQDYVYCFQQIFPYADYVIINLSSPNTSNLRQLQHGDLLRSIITPLKDQQQRLSDKLGKKVPLLVKLSPDLEKEELVQVLEDLIKLKVEGVIATNTTIGRPPHLSYVNEVGGLSGAPLFERSTAMVRAIYQQVGEELPIIAVGGILSAQHAKEKLAAGAKLVQLYTGLIYQGPGLIKQINDSLN